MCVCAAEHSSSVVTIHPSIADVQEGQSLELSCHAPGDPPPRVTWSRASGQLSSNHQVVPQNRCKAATISLQTVTDCIQTTTEDVSLSCVTCSFSFLLLQVALTSLPCAPQVRGNQLRILAATPEDSGDYICRVQGNTGNPVPHVHQSSVSVSVTSSSSRKSAGAARKKAQNAAKKKGAITELKSSFSVWKYFIAFTTEESEADCSLKSG